MFTEWHVVDNRVFLLGLDNLYRDAMKRHERAELLVCARRVAAVLNVPPADVPVEGYYAEDEQLTEYFRLVRALQDVDEAARSGVNALPEFQRLRDITSAPLYGRPEHDGHLLPVGRDALSQALRDTFPVWTISRLTAAAHSSARAMDDTSLVGLAALAKDVVVLAAVRESVVLYAEIVLGAAPPRRQPEYIWKVDEELAQQAGRFIGTFNALFGENLPPADSEQAEQYWHAYIDNDILGRCVRLGLDDRLSPARHYHWAICRGADGEFTVQEFWKPDAWTTMRFRSALGGSGQCPEL